MAGLALLRNTIVRCPRLRVGSGLVQTQHGLSRSPLTAARIYGPDTSGPPETKHWKNERIVSALLMPLIPAAVAYPHPVLDCALSATLVLHTHWGLATVCNEYIHGEYLPRLISPIVLLSSILALGGLFYLNFNDVGLGQCVRMLYTEL